MTIKIALNIHLLFLMMLLLPVISYSQDTVKAKENTFIVTPESLIIIDAEQAKERIIMKEGCVSVRKYYDGTEEDPKDWHIAFYYNHSETGDITTDDVMFPEGEKEGCEKLFDSLMRLWKMRQ